MDKWLGWLGYLKELGNATIQGKGKLVIKTGFTPLKIETGDSFC